MLDPQARSEVPEPTLPNSYARMKALRLDRINALREHLNAWLPERYSAYEALDLEIGCGHGHWLRDYGTAHPERLCIGIDIMSRRVRLGNQKREKRSLENIVFLKAEAREFLEAAPLSARFDRVFLLFPDPWPKARHHKKRLVQEPFLTQLKPYMTANGLFLFRTDHEGYFTWAQEAVSDHPDWKFKKGHPWPFESGSYFQDLMDSWQSFIAELT